MFPEGTVSVWKTDSTTVVTFFDKTTNQLTVLKPDQSNIDENKNITIVKSDGNMIKGHLNYIDPSLVTQAEAPQKQQQQPEKPSIFERLKTLFISKPAEVESIHYLNMTYKVRPIGKGGDTYEVELVFPDVPSKKITVVADPVTGYLPVLPSFLYLDLKNQQTVLGELQGNLIPPTVAPPTPAPTETPTSIPTPEPSPTTEPQLQTQDHQENNSPLECKWLPESIQYWAQEISAAAKIEGVDPMFVAILMIVESGGNPEAVSKNLEGKFVGALGLMQLMPGTAAEQARKLGIDESIIATFYNYDNISGNTLIKDPALNVKIGVHYLASMLREYGQANDPDWVQSVILASIAYNAGPGAANDYLNGKGLSDETDRYKIHIPNMWKERKYPTSPAYDNFFHYNYTHIQNALAWINSHPR